MKETSEIPGSVTASLRVFEGKARAVGTQACWTENADAIAGDGARYLTFMTGPSRTADIERTLTIGVHGPRALHVILVGPSS